MSGQDSDTTGTGGNSHAPGHDDDGPRRMPNSRYRDRVKQATSRAPNTRHIDPVTPARPVPPPQDPALARLERATLLARAILLWERTIPAIAPAAGVAAAFASLAFLGVFSELSGAAHITILGLFAGAFLVALSLGLRGWSLPDARAGRARIETDSGIKHRPLEALLDRPATSGNDPATAGLWQAHRQRMQQLVRHLRIGPPVLHAARRDRHALRFAAIMAVFVSLVFAGDDWRGRLHDAFTPAFGLAAASGPPQLDIWITPPDYTGLAPVFLQTAMAGLEAEVEAGERTREEAVIEVPAGSEIIARVTGGRSAPVLDLPAGSAAGEFSEAGGNGWQYEGTLAPPETAPQPAPATGEPPGNIHSEGTVSVTQGGRVLGRYPVRILSDMAPEIRFTEAPSATARHAMRIDYEARDDYGIARVEAQIRLASPDPGEAAEGAVVIELPVPGRNPAKATSTSFHDLTPHPWAGRDVSVRLSASDGAGNFATSQDAPFTLPERPFSHPVARAIIAERSRLIDEAQSWRLSIARDLGMIMARPDAYGGDLVVFLGLRSAVSRLRRDRSDEATTSVIELLWDLALRVEDGGLSIAERNLREAQNALMDALADPDTGNAELQRLMDQLQQAMMDYLAAMQQQAMENMASGEMPEMQPMDPNAQALTPEDLQRMMQEMRDMSDAGAREAAMQMLSRMQAMMENLQAGGGGGQMPGQEMLEELQRLMGEQQQLMDESFRAGQGGQPSPGPGAQPGQQGQPGGQGQGNSGAGGGGSFADRQEGLRRGLGDVMRQLGEQFGNIPDALGRAERSMNSAGEALGDGRPGRAVPSQRDALDEMAAGMQAIMDEMAEAAGQQGQTARRPGRDPLGRSGTGTGWQDGTEVEIPSEVERTKVREILEELRRRSGDYRRPEVERDYIDRLLERF